MTVNEKCDNHKCKVCECKKRMKEEKLAKAKKSNQGTQ